MCSYRQHELHPSLWGGCGICFHVRTMCVNTTRSRVTANVQRYTQQLTVSVLKPANRVRNGPFRRLRNPYLIYKSLCLFWFVRLSRRKDVREGQVDAVHVQAEVTSETRKDTCVADLFSRSEEPLPAILDQPYLTLNLVPNRLKSES